MKRRPTGQLRTAARRIFILLCVTGLLLTGAASAGVSHASLVPQHALCSSGFVDGIIGGEHKCLHAGEFCAVRYESDYEKYGVTCLSGRLSSGCRARSALPDPACSPGAVFTSGSKAAICVPGYSSSVRNVPESEKRAVYREYGIRTRTSGQFEVDHLISLELGGSNDIANLWPEAALPRPGFHQKDVLENELHARICSGSMPLATAQRLIARNWLATYRQLHG